MGRFVKGEIVVVPFPFSDLSQAKRRPAMVITALTGDDLILCMITSQVSKDSDAILLRSSDFARGTLSQESYIRPNRLFTADEAIVSKSVGRVSDKLIKEVVEKIAEIIRR